MEIIPQGYADLKPQQRIRCAKYLSILGDEEQSVMLTLLTEKSGENTLKNIWSKLQLLAVENEATQNYYEELDKSFQLNEPVTDATIISTVSLVRRKLRMQPYITGLVQNCMSDFLKLFIVKTEVASTRTQKKDGTWYNKKSKVSFTPQFRLKQNKKVM
jgi:hypothetical protein